MTTVETESLVRSTDWRTRPLVTGDTEDASRAFADPGLSLVPRLNVTCHTWPLSSAQVDPPRGLRTPPSRWGQAVLDHRGRSQGPRLAEVPFWGSWMRTRQPRLTGATAPDLFSARTRKPAMSPEPPNRERLGTGLNGRPTASRVQPAALNDATTLPSCHRGSLSGTPTGPRRARATRGPSWRSTPWGPTPHPPPAGRGRGGRTPGRGPACEVGK